MCLRMCVFVWVNSKLVEKNELLLSVRFLIWIFVPYVLFCTILVKGLFHVGRTRQRIRWSCTEVCEGPKWQSRCTEMYRMCKFNAVAIYH